MTSSRRLHVSLIATLASPAQLRLDTWHRLVAATQRLSAAVAANLDSEKYAAEEPSCSTSWRPTSGTGCSPGPRRWPRCGSTSPATTSAGCRTWPPGRCIGCRSTATPRACSRRWFRCVIAQVRETDARTRLISDGDVAGAIAAARIRPREWPSAGTPSRRRA